MQPNIILMTDSYKFSHFLQYPKGTRYVSSYIEARSAPEGTEIVHLGIQPFIQEYLLEDYIVRSDIEEAEEMAQLHGVPFNKEGWLDIYERYGGWLPIKIEALPEGTVIPAGIPQVQVINTDPKHFWLTSYMETAILRATWYPSTVATKAREAKKIIKRYLEETSDSLDGLPFKLHDFGARGVSSDKSAALGGMAHLVNFMGTDTIEALRAAKYYYGPNEAGFIAGYSVPAAEHSTITSWGENGEKAAYENMIDKFSAPGKIYSVVSDSYDIWNAIDHIWGEELREKVANSGGKLVVRPDSGVPEIVVPQVLSKLAAKFGYTRNKKGYMVLPSYLGVIQGDGITLQSIPIILENIKKAGWSTDNVVFGMGGGGLQQVNRDTFSYAMKCNAVNINGDWMDVWKHPVGDKGKTSKAGRQMVFYDECCGKWQVTGNPSFRKYELDNKLVRMYENGQSYNEATFEEVRNRAKL